MDSRSLSLLWWVLGLSCRHILRTEGHRHPGQTQTLGLVCLWANLTGWVFSYWILSVLFMPKKSHQRSPLCDLMYQDTNRWILNMCKPWMLFQPQNISHSLIPANKRDRRFFGSWGFSPVFGLPSFQWDWLQYLVIESVPLLDNIHSGVNLSFPKLSPHPNHPPKAHLLHVPAKSIWYHQCAPSVQRVKARAPAQVSSPGSLWLRVGSGQMPKLSIIWSNWQLWGSELGRSPLK